MPKTDLVLSLFPGIGLLDMAFEEEGFCVVRGPDLLWGGDIHRFHPPSGKFDGVIGGPPCQAHSPLASINRAQGKRVAPDLTPEFERVVRKAQPRWFLMENVRHAPDPDLSDYDYEVVRRELDNQWLGSIGQTPQRRYRVFWFGFRTTSARYRFHIETPALAPLDSEPTVCSKSGGRRALWVTNPDGSAKGGQGRSSASRHRERTPEEMLELQGFSAHLLDESPFTVAGKKKVIANGVPLPMGRAVARAVKKALS